MQLATQGPPPLELVMLVFNSKGLITSQNPLIPSTEDYPNKLLVSLRSAKAPHPHPTQIQSTNVRYEKEKQSRQQEIKSSSNEVYKRCSSSTIITL